MSAPLPDAPLPSAPLLRVRDLKKHYPIRRGILGRTVGQVRAVDGVSFDVAPGETLGVVGESGCGKTTTGRAVLRLVEPTAGRVVFDGTDVASLSGEPLRTIRRRMQMVFQDPLGSLDPRQNVESLLSEPLHAHDLGGGKKGIAERIRTLLDAVGLPSAALRRYPHEFSGGQRQRIGIARAMILNPDLVIADEPVSALDVSVQAQVINLLEQLQDMLGLTYLVIAHDLAVVRHISDLIGVMYLGTLVEQAPSDDLYASPLHPYTIALMSAIPIPDPVVEDQRERILLRGDLPSPADPPSGCRFRTRCQLFVTLDPDQQQRCIDLEPPRAAALPVEPGEPVTDHEVACHWARIRAVV